MKLKLCSVLFLAALTGCTAGPGYRPIVDNGTPKGDYNVDSDECRAVANNVQITDSAGTGAVAGALFGALLGAAVGLRGNNLAQVAAAGGVSGAAHGLVYGSAQWTQVFNNCLRGRGYNVLN
jgi:uncharacterized protein YcfJ